MNENFLNSLQGEYEKAFEQEGPKTASELLESLKLENRYSDAEFYASGGMKEIYKIRDQKTGRILAMARMKSFDDDETLERFIREAKITAYLEHPNIIPVHDIGLEDE